MMTLSGSGCRGLPPPARPTLAARCVPGRGPGGTFVLWVREGGTLELCASLTGSCCLASKAARRALRRCTSAHNAAMSASLSCSESRVRSGKLSMLSLSDTATLLVKRVAPSGELSNYDRRPLRPPIRPDAWGLADVLRQRSPQSPSAWAFPGWPTASCPRAWGRVAGCWEPTAGAQTAAPPFADSGYDGRYDRCRPPSPSVCGLPFPCEQSLWAVAEHKPRPPGESLRARRLGASPPPWH